MTTEQTTRETSWATELVGWLEARGYQRRENGPRNPATGHGWYSHPGEYQRGNVRVRVNTGGVVVLRDPGCTIEVSRPAYGGMREQWSPNARRLDVAPQETDAEVRRQVELYESRPAYTLEEALAVYG